MSSLNLVKGQNGLAVQPALLPQTAERQGRAGSTNKKEIRRIVLPHKPKGHGVHSEGAC